MDMAEFLRTIDQQMKDRKIADQNASKGDRRKDTLPVPVERRSGTDRRWFARKKTQS